MSARFFPCLLSVLNFLILRSRFSGDSKDANNPALGSSFETPFSTALQEKAAKVGGAR